MEWMFMPYRRYAEFSGRSRRKEFWMFYLFTLLVSFVGYALMLMGGGLDAFAGAAAIDGAVAPPEVGLSFGPLFWVGTVGLVLFAVASLIPSLAVTVRRLHDRNLSGWYLLGFMVAAVILNMIPGIGPLLYLLLAIGWLVLLALPGTPGANKYGPDPLGRADAEVFA